MDRINGANTIDIGSGRRGFRGRSALAGIAGTELAASWHNQVQEELMAILEAAGLVPSATDWTQVLQALGKLYAPAKARYWFLAGGAGTIPASVDTRIANWSTQAGYMPASAINKTAGTVTIGAADAGVYLLAASAAVVNATVVDNISIRVNGVSWVYQAMQSPSDVSNNDPSCAGIYTLAAGDVVDVSYYQTRSGGGSNTLVSGVQVFSAVRLGVL